MYNVEIQIKPINDFEMYKCDIVLCDTNKIKLYRNNLIFKEFSLDYVNNIKIWK